MWRPGEPCGAGKLDLRTRELIKLGMATGAGSVSAVQSHTHRALDAGTTPEEVERTLLLGVTTLGWPTTMAAYTWAKVALEDHTRGERIGAEGDDRGSPWPR